jgi:hypothetical protein
MIKREMKLSIGGSCSLGMLSLCICRCKNIKKEKEIEMTWRPQTFFSLWKLANRSVKKHEKQKIIIMNR